MSKALYPEVETFYINSSTKRAIGQAARKLNRRRSQLLRDIIEPALKEILCAAPSPPADA